jgi:Fic family protein
LNNSLPVQVISQKLELHLCIFKFCVDDSIVDLERFRNSPVGSFIPFSGVDPSGVEYHHAAFAPIPLSEEPILSGATWRAVARANRALGRLHQGARFVATPSLLRQPTLRREAQSTSALEGTFAPLEDVLAADVIDRSDRSSALTEVLNFVEAAERAFSWIQENRPLTVGLICELHRLLVSGTQADTEDAGKVRSIHVAIGSVGGTVEDARFLPMRPGQQLEAGFADLMDWIKSDFARQVDPVIAAAMVHYQFETLHPFNDGNGRLGRLLIVVQLLQAEMLPNSLLSVSPWFEARRNAYQDALSKVSVTGNWDQWIEFFAEGLEASANDTAKRLERVLDIQASFHRQIREAGISGIARAVADHMIGAPFSTIRQLSEANGKTYQANSNAVNRLIELGILDEVPFGSRRIIRAPEVVRAYQN